MRLYILFTFNTCTYKSYVWRDNAPFEVDQLDWIIIKTRFVFI